MDEMKIVSGFTTTILSKLLGFALRKKLGYDINIQLNTVEATVKDGKTWIHIDANAEMDKDELMKVLKSVGI